MVFPPRLIRQGITRGEAWVRVSISEQGELLDALITRATERDFGDEALRVARAWTYEPARVRGEPVGVVGDITIVFTMKDSVAVERRLDARTDDTVDREGRFAYAAVSVKSLDRIPRPIHVVPPVYPDEWSSRGIKGRVTVEFYIDESGAVRVPRVMQSGHDLLASSAIAAIKQWQFESPTRRGQPVLARAEQTFTFDPPKK